MIKLLRRLFANFKFLK